VQDDYDSELIGLTSEYPKAWFIRVYYVVVYECYARGSNSDIHTLIYNVFVRVEIEPSLRYLLYLHSLTSPSPPFPS